MYSVNMTKISALEGISMIWPFELLNNFIISVVSCSLKTFCKMLNLLSCKIQPTMINHFLMFNHQCNLNIQVRLIISVYLFWVIEMDVVCGII